MGLTYRAAKHASDLAENECVVRRAHDQHGDHWHLVFRARTSRGEVEYMGIPVGPASVESPRLTWALTNTAPGVWQVSPSIRVRDGDGELWHETPAIVGVPVPAPWEGSWV
jgi:hypothetical protein